LLDFRFCLCKDISELTVDTQCFPCRVNFWAAGLSVDILFHERAVERHHVV
jgi:hypothetical protein